MCDLKKRNCEIKLTWSPTCLFLEFLFCQNEVWSNSLYPHVVICSLSTPPIHPHFLFHVMRDEWCLRSFKERIYIYIYPIVSNLVENSILQLHGQTHTFTQQNINFDLKKKDSIGERRPCRYINWYLRCVF